MTAPARKLAATQSSARTGEPSADLWQTPLLVLERTRRIGKIRLDPCTTADNPTDAMFHICPPDNGLLVDWYATCQVPQPSAHATVYVNPPYSQAAMWAEKIVEEADAGCEVVTLVAARPDARWFWHLVWDNADAVCFWKGRLRFVGATSSAPFPSAVVYHGARPWAFEAAFHDAGKVLRLR